MLAILPRPVKPPKPPKPPFVKPKFLKSPAFPPNSPTPGRPNNFPFNPVSAPLPNIPPNCVPGIPKPIAPNIAALPIGDFTTFLQS